MQYSKFQCNYCNGGGFVNAGIMTLGQAVGVIIGANIGTTMTAFSISLNLTDIAPIIVFIGVGLVFFQNAKLEKHWRDPGGFSILFIGMRFMSDALKPCVPMRFQRILVSMSHPILVYWLERL